jgi:hypothetical protein
MNSPGFRAASFLVRKDAIMPKHYDAEVKACHYLMDQCSPARRPTSTPGLLTTCRGTI